MAWRIEFDDAAKKELARLVKRDRQTAKRITQFLRERVAVLEDPRSIGEALRGSALGEFWKYRVGAHQIIASIEDEAVRILVVRIGDRKEVYRKR